MSDIMLTTIDNPYNPFDQFEQWLSYDLAKGYDCCGLVDRLTRTATAFSEEWQARDVEQAIDDFLKVDPIGLYKKVERI